MAKQILIVEDDSDVVGYIEHLLKRLGYAVCAVVSSGEAAMQKAAEVHPDLVLIDMMLAGDMDGIAVAEQMSARFNIPVIYLTAYVDQHLLQRAKIAEPFGYVLKPFAERRLHLNIEIALYRHEMERRFKEREQWLSTILKSIGDAVIATDKNGRIQFINSVAETLTGWQQEDAFGKDLEEVFNVISEDTETSIKTHIMKALRSGIIMGVAEPNVLAARDGKKTPIDYSAAPIRDDKKNRTGVVLVFRDITRRKEAEEALRLTADALQNQTQILQSILDSMSDGVMVADETGKSLFFNLEAEGIIDIPMDTTLNEWSKKYGLFLPDTITPFPSDEFPLTRAIRGELSDNVEMFIRNPKVPEGGYIEVAGRPLQDESGKQRGGVIVFHDVTERKRAEEALARANQRLEAVLDSTGDAIAMFDVTGHLLFANRGYEDMFELPTGALKQMSPGSLRDHIKRYFQEPEHFEEMETSLFAHLEHVFEDVAEVRRPKRKMLYRFAAPVYDIEQNVIGRITVFRDISKEIEISQMKVEVSRLRTELEMKYAFDKIVGKSKEMKAVYALMQQAIESNITVLVQGDSGTGKELVARAIHFNSPRKGGPFVAVNCAAIPESLIESELFGHERGAFTGATMQRIGKFESANGGTIFLDEIADMQLLVQAKLLRVLQEREIQRVGGTDNIPIDVRVIAATNKDLETAVTAGEFREDLFYRITGFPILIPPLKERREDIPLLGHHFLQEYAEAADKSITGFSTGALQLLMSYDWPGNVRELENTIERAVLLETADVLQASNPALSDLRSTSRGYTPDSYGDSMLPFASTSTEILSLEEIEKHALIHALEVTDNNITKAAQALGINRVTIHRKLKKYDLPARK